jgi:hypothetical protein
MNGEGKGKQVTLAQEELIQNPSKAQIESRIKELRELKQDLAPKVHSFARSGPPFPCHVI